MSDKFIDDGEGLIFLDADGNEVTVTHVRPGDAGHISDDEEDEIPVMKAAAPDAEHQSLTDSQRTAYEALRPDRAALDAPRAALQTVIQDALARQGTRVADAVRTYLGGVSKADEPDTPPPAVVSLELAQWEAGIVSAALEGLGSWDFVIDDVSTVLETVANQSAQETAAVIGADSVDGLVDVVSEKSVQMAEERAAELVGRRVLPDGTIIDNPNPRWAISDSTRTMIRERIQTVIRNNEGRDALIRSLEDDHAFSPARAEMIARTEISDINSRAHMVTMREAESMGIDLQKRWILGHKPCEICIANAEEGAIPLEQSFSSGDDTTPAHPHCVCTVIPEVS